MDHEIGSNKLILHTSFTDTINELLEVNIKLPNNPDHVLFDFGNQNYPPNGELVTSINEIKAINLNPKDSEIDNLLAKEIVAYDESINKFTALEGTAYLMSHCLVNLGKSDFIPLCLLAFYFYTRSNNITNRTKSLKHSTNPEMDSQIDFINDKIELLTKYSPKDSLLFIDGPLIGGDVYTYMIRDVKKFLSKGIIPIYFVKNSTSNLVTDNLSSLTGKFNSDMHWAYTFLKKGQRTNFFKYVDKSNPRNAKIFCYLKAFEISPQRIEFHVDTFNKHQNEIESIMNLIFYLILVQGYLQNPQIRPIAVAEKYARAILQMTDIDKLVRDSGLIPTMNQERFGW